MRHRALVTGPNSRGTRTAGNLFNPDCAMVRFTPDTDVTDPSHHAPAFYELWARRGPAVGRPFWARAVTASRDFFQEVTNPVTGLAPDYANSDRSLRGGPRNSFQYADDSNIYVRSERAGQRVMESVKRFITEKLKLKVNEAKSAVPRPQEREFLGFTFTAGPEVKRAIAPKAPDRFKRRIREIARRAKGVNIETTMEELAPYMRGCGSCFGSCETPEVLIYLARWVRLRLRAALWRQWKTPRRRRAALLELGVGLRLASNTAASGHGPWYLSAPGTL
jgi:hypothetical protein